jgi:hypothetical protein
MTRSWLCAPIVFVAACGGSLPTGDSDTITRTIVIATPEGKPIVKHEVITVEQQREERAALEARSTNEGSLGTPTPSASEAWSPWQFCLASVMLYDANGNELCFQAAPNTNSATCVDLTQVPRCNAAGYCSTWAVFNNANKTTGFNYINSVTFNSNGYFSPFDGYPDNWEQDFTPNGWVNSILGPPYLKDQQVLCAWL